MKLPSFNLFGRSKEALPLGKDVIRQPFAASAQDVPAQAIKDYQEFRHFMNRMNRSMDAASVDNFTRDLAGEAGSANTAIFPAKQTIRYRSRAIAQNTPHGRGLMRTYADYTVGDDPFELLMEGGDKQADGSVNEPEEYKEIVAAWNVFCQKNNFMTRKNMSFMEAMRVEEMSAVREGRSFMRIYNGYEFNEFGFAVDWLEEDHCQEQFNGISGKDSRYGAGNPIRGSIEYHPKYNFPLAIWLLRRHPGEFYGLNALIDEGKNFREQIPADQIIIWDNLRTRFEQDAGGSEMDACVLPLWRLHQFNKSLTLSSIDCASNPWWIEEAKPTGLDLPGSAKAILDGFSLNYGNGIIPSEAMPDQSTAQQKSTSGRVVSPAMREELPPGKSLKHSETKFPLEGATDFRKDNERELSVATHGSVQQLGGDYQNLGFIAGLMSQQAFQRNIRVRQKSKAENLRELFKAWLKATILKGYFDKKGVSVSMLKLEQYVQAAKFKGQQFEFVNPLVQGQTLILLNEAGHMTDQQVQDALPNGITTDKLYAIRKAEQEKKLGMRLMAPSTVAAMPSIAHEGTAAPGEERPIEGAAPADVTPPKPASSPHPPAKTKVQRPGVNRSQRIPGTIDDATKMLLEMSQNGQH